MIIRDLLGLLDLSKTQVFCIHKLIKFIITNKSEHFIFTTL